MNDFVISGPACLSLSGGRTSAYMVHRIIEALDGRLPDDVKIVFCNTGKEMLETLDFVQECSERWGVPITWLEYRSGKKWEVVNYQTASRDAEPFAALISDRNFLPNPSMRFCTQELKIMTMERHLTQDLGWEFFTNVVGYRADEPERVAKLGAGGSKHFGRYAPLALAGVTHQEVGRFWMQNDFDLRLPSVEGRTLYSNCDLCFLKGTHQTMSIIREQPQRALWWIKQETEALRDGKQATFRSDRPSYSEMYKMATSHGELFEFPENELKDCACTD